MACKAPAPYTLYVKAKPPGQRNKMDEPVAWMTEDGRVANKDEYELLADHQLDRSIYTIPLYASPRSAPIEGGRVLTPEEAYRCWVDAEYLWPRLIAPKPPWKEFFMQVLQKEASLSPQTMSRGMVERIMELFCTTINRNLSLLKAGARLELQEDLRSRLLSMAQQEDKDAPTPNSEASRSEVVELVEALSNLYPMAVAHASHHSHGMEHHPVHAEFLKKATELIAKYPTKP